MPRVKRGVTARARHNKVLKQTKGQIGSRHLLYRRAHEALTHSLFYHDRDRHDRKGEFRRLWIARINAAAREEGTTYNQLMHGLKLAGVDVNRKILADLAVRDAGAFKTLVDVANQARSQAASNTETAAPRGDTRLKAPSPRSAADIITSAANDKIKFARSLARKKERVAAHQFLIEGTRIVEEAVRAGLVPALVFYERAALNNNPRVRQLVVSLRRQSEVYEVNAAVMHALSDTETPQGIAAVVPLPEHIAPASPRLTLLLDRVRDPGNLGTILRTSWAAGVDSVFFAPETADPYNPKVVRAAMGAHFHVALAQLSWAEITARLQGIPRVYLADTTGTQNYLEADWSPPSVLIIGGEAEGASPETETLATATLAIPMPGSAESLNAAIAAGILLFAAVRA